MPYNQIKPKTDSFLYTSGPITLAVRYPIRLGGKIH